MAEIKYNITLCQFSWRIFNHFFTGMWILKILFLIIQMEEEYSNCAMHNNNVLFSKNMCRIKKWKKDAERMEIKVTPFPCGSNGKTMAGWRRSDGGERGRNKLPAEESLRVYLGRNSPSYSNIVREKPPSENLGRDETTQSFPSHTHKLCDGRCSSPRRLV